MTADWHSSNSLIKTLTQGQRDQVDGLMAQLQETERALSSDRAPGLAMAPRHVDYLMALADATDGAFLTVMTGDEVLGFCVVILTEEDADDRHLLNGFKLAGEVTDLIVDPNHQKKGIARALIQAAMGHCQARGVQQLKLKTLAANTPARGAFEALGFSAHEVIHTIDL
jgi:ribosomal protein S18 acetylase RimI-like enzyme